MEINNQTAKNSDYNTKDNNQDVSSIHNLFFIRSNNNNSENNTSQACHNVEDNKTLSKLFADNIHNNSLFLEKYKARFNRMSEEKNPIIETKILANNGLAEGNNWLSAMPKNNPFDISQKKLDNVSDWAFDNFISSQTNYSTDENELSNSEWVRVAELSVGDEIAVSSIKQENNKTIKQ